ncbi:hypothetical protein PSPO01_00951 [Paraphaeosphaeria sporulosa]
MTSWCSFGRQNTSQGLGPNELSASSRVALIAAGLKFWATAHECPFKRVACASLVAARLFLTLVPRLGAFASPGEDVTLIALRYAL